LEDETDALVSRRTRRRVCQMAFSFIFDDLSDFSMMDAPGYGCGLLWRTPLAMIRHDSHPGDGVYRVSNPEAASWNEPLCGNMPIAM
jgi:hypothetical protein